MKRIKIIISVLMVLFLSGCTAEYNLVINNNDSITEDVSIIEKNSVIETFSTSVNGFLSSEYTLVRKDGTYKNYDINVYTKNDNAIGNGKKIYKNFNNFKNNSIIVTEMFKDISIINNDNIIEIKMLPQDKFRFFESNTQYTSLLDKVVFKITLPYEVIEGNYDNVEENTYVWNIDKEEDLKEINIKYKKRFVLFDKSKNGLMIIGGLIGSILIIVLIISLKHKRNNKY